MSTLHVENLKGLSSGGNANKVIIPSGQTLDASNGFVTPAGHVIQVNQGSLNSATITTATFTDLGSLSITPKASTNKILVLFEQHIYVTELSSNSWRGANVRLLRDTTTIYGDPADQYGESFHLEGNIDRYMTYSTRQYLDSPSTTSSVTYKVQGNSKGGLASVLYNYHGYGSGGRITLMEIAQ